GDLHTRRPMPHAAHASTASRASDRRHAPFPLPSALFASLRLIPISSSARHGAGVVAPAPAGARAPALPAIWLARANVISFTLVVLLVVSTGCPAGHPVFFHRWCYT